MALAIWVIGGVSDLAASDSDTAVSFPAFNQQSIFPISFLATAPLRSLLQPSGLTATTSDRHYWAKGTGFGTGSSASTWNMDGMLAKKREEESLFCYSCGVPVCGQPGNGSTPSSLEVCPSEVVAAQPVFSPSCTRLLPP